MSECLSATVCVRVVYTVHIIGFFFFIKIISHRATEFWWLYYLQEHRKKTNFLKTNDNVARKSAFKIRDISTKTKKMEFIVKGKVWNKSCWFKLLFRIYLLFWWNLENEDGRAKKHPYLRLFLKMVKIKDYWQ